RPLTRRQVEGAPPMASNPQVHRLLKEMLELGKTPEEVCRDCPELLPEVRQRWRQFPRPARPRRREGKFRPHQRPSAVIRCEATWGRAASAPSTSATMRSSTG